LPNLICLYGYSLVAFIPASLLCSIPSGGIQWLALIAGFGYSAAFLLRNLWCELSAHVLPQLATESGSPAGRKRAAAILAGIIGLHLVFALVMKVFFFPTLASAAAAAVGVAPGTTLPTDAAAVVATASATTPALLTPAPTGP
jgi:hypothetical protein